MTKLSLTNLANLQNEQTAVSTINANSAATATALENTLSRNGASPNQMSSNLDMNSNHILNLPTAGGDNEPVRRVDVIPLVQASLINAVPTSLPIGVTAVPGRANVRTFGALGNGVADDTSAINAAAASLVLGGEVYFPQGTYLITGTINVNLNNIAFRGMGQEISIIKAKASSNIVSMITWAGSFGEISDLTLDGNRVNSGTITNNINSTCITLLAPHFLLKRTEVMNGGFQGFIGGSAASYFTAVDCYCHHNGTISDIWGAAIKFIGGPQYHSISRCVFESNYGLTAPGPSGSFYGGAGLALDSYFVNVDGCVFLNNYNGGGQMGDGGSNGVERFWTISNNLFFVTGEPSNSGTSGVELTGLGQSIIGNVFRGGKGFAVAFDLASGMVCGDCVISGNTVLSMDAGGVAMLETGGGGLARNITITGNKFKSIGIGISAGNLTTGLVVSGNNFSEVTTPISGAIALTDIIMKDNYPTSVGLGWPSATLNTLLPTGTPGAFVATGTCHYQINGKTAEVDIVIDISANSTGSGSLQIGAFPFTVKNASTLSGRAQTNSGKMITGTFVANTNSCLCVNYDGTWPGSTGERLVLSGTVEIV